MRIHTWFKYGPARSARAAKYRLNIRPVRYVFAASSNVDSGESFLFVALAVISGVWAFHIGRRSYAVVHFGKPPRAANAYAATFFSCLGGLWISLTRFAAAEIRDDLAYQGLFVAGGAAAIAAATIGLCVLGIDAVDDGVARANPAACVATCGLWVAVTLCAIGSNIGDGDFVGTGFIPLAIGLAMLIGLTAVYSAATRMFAVITVDRSRAAGVRFAGFIIAAAVPVANAAAGNWVSVSATGHDFAITLPLLLGLLGLAIGLQKRAEKTETAAVSSSWKRGLGSSGLLLAISIGVTWGFYR
jgi:hypothetical protein